MSRQPKDFLPAVEAARIRGIRPGASLLLMTILGLISGFLVWAHYTSIDEVTRAQGRVVLSSKTQVIQNLEGGILSSVLVREGDRVDAGDQLLRIDATIADARYQKSRAEYLSYLGAIARIKAELTDKAPVFPNALLVEAPLVVENEKSLLFSRKKEQTKELRVLQHRVQQKKQGLKELQSQVAGFEKSLGLLQKELDLNRPLLEIGGVSGAEILHLERLYAEKETELLSSRLALPRVEEAVQEALEQVEAKKLAFRTDALTKLSDLEAKLSAVKEIATAEQDRVRRTEVRSPVRGIVKHIRFNTPGGIIKPGDPIMEIVPIEENLLIEGWVKPQDVAFLHPGLKGVIHITAYDPSIYGGLDARIESISADTFSDNQGHGYFRVRLRTTSTVFQKSGKSLPIIPGMDASINIITGKKSILSYIINPIIRVQLYAFSEK